MPEILRPTEARIEASQTGKAVRITVRGQLDVEPTVIYLPTAMLEAFVAQQLLARANGELQGSARPGLVGRDGVAPGAKVQ